MTVHKCVWVFMLLLLVVPAYYGQNSTEDSSAGDHNSTTPTSASIMDAKASHTEGSSNSSTTEESTSQTTATSPSEPPSASVISSTSEIASTTSPTTKAPTSPTTKAPTSPTTKLSTTIVTEALTTVAKITPITTTNSTAYTETNATLPNYAATTKATVPSTEVDVGPTYPPGEIEPFISISISFIFLMLGLCIILVHLMIKYKFHFLPESIAFVLIGIVVGLLFWVMQKAGYELQYQEKFSPSSFFLLLLPPIIFESGYSLHKGNFFQNLGSILLFAVVGTAVSTCIVGGGLLALSKLDVVYELNAVQSFTFGALISAVDPVATLAIFHALDVSPTLNMLVFGESVLNDAVSIVMTKTIMQQATSTASTGMVLLQSLGQFLLMFFVSALLGTITALCSALFLKFVNLRQHYSIEFAMWFIFAFGPYFLAEGLKLSGIMSVLFCGIVMSHYTHFNISPVTQVTVQQTMRTIAFMAETVVFLYIGMQVFTITTFFRVELIIWSLILILIGRAANIFPLSFLVNRFRTTKISHRMQFVMWFSGLRGAIAYALALNLGEKGKSFGTAELIRVLDTTTLIIVLFTIIFLGGSTLPLLKFLSKQSGVDDLTLSKTEEQGTAVSKTPDEEDRPTGRRQWFLYFDYNYVKPLLIRRFTKQEVRAARVEMQRRTNEWYEGLREASSDEDGSRTTSSSRLSVRTSDRTSPVVLY